MIKALVNYSLHTADRPRYHANDVTRDVLHLDPRQIAIANARDAADPPRLDREGFALIDHKSAIADFSDPLAIADRHAQEIRALVAQATGADAVMVTAPGVLRFGEKSKQSGALNNSRPARFVHIDVNDATAVAFAARSQPEGRRIRRFAHYNIWRSLSGAPQDVPLAVCDARTLGAADLIEADAVFDEPDKPEWSFVGLVIASSPAHRWHYFRDMTPDEVLIFKTNDSDPDEPHHVPHSAFDDPSCPPDTHPRGSIEMRAIAYWLG
jgi:hypothetical protein